MIQQPHQAAIASLTSGTTAVGAFALANEIAQFVAAIVAIISGLAATYYWIRKAHKK